MYLGDMLVVVTRVAMSFRHSSRIFITDVTATTTAVNLTLNLICYSRSLLLFKTEMCFPESVTTLSNCSLEVLSFLSQLFCPRFSSSYSNVEQCLYRTVLIKGAGFIRSRGFNNFFPQKKKLKLPYSQ